MHPSLLRIGAATALAIATAAGAATKPVDPSLVVLENGPVKVTAGDFEATMTRFPEGLRDMARAQPEVVMRNVDALFVNRSLAAKAVAAGLDKDPLFAKRLEQIRESYLAGRWLEHLEATAKLPELEARAKELYAADPKRFMEPPSAQVKHIVVSHMNRTPEMARERVLEARKKLVDGAPLADVAREYSDAGRATPNPGDLGTVRKSQLDPVLGDAVFSVPQGKWSDPIPSRTATHIILVSDRKAERQRTFQEAKLDILNEEIEKARKRVLDKEMAAIRDNPANKIYPDRIESLRSDFDPSKIETREREAIRQIDSLR